MGREKHKLETNGNRIWTHYPFNDKKKRGPTIHLHDVDEEEIIHFYAGPFDSDALYQLQSRLVGIWYAYRGRSSVKSIRLVMLRSLMPIKKTKKDPKGVKEDYVVIPQWFLKSMPAILLSGNSKLPAGQIEIEQREQGAYALPSWIWPNWPYDQPPRPVDPDPDDGNTDPDWNGIPSNRVGACREGLVLNLLGRSRYDEYEELLQDVVTGMAEDQASDELGGYEARLAAGEPTKKRIDAIYKDRRKGIDYSGYNNPHARSVIDVVAHDLIDPKLYSLCSNPPCDWKRIVVIVPNQLADDLEHFTSWKKFKTFFEGMGVELSVVYRS